MKRLVLLSISCAAAFSQEWVTNYLGGVRPASTTYSSLVTQNAAIAVSNDGRWLYVTQAARGLVLRYDLRERKVDAIPVNGLREVVGIATADDGTALIPVGNRSVARIELDGRVTIPGIPFNPQTPPSSLAAVVRPSGGASRGAYTGVVGLNAGNLSLWSLISGNTNFQSTGVNSCPTGRCDNTNLPAGGRFGLNVLTGFVWGAANPRENIPVYILDNGGPFDQAPPVIARVDSQTVTVLGSPRTTAIPIGTSRERLWRPDGLSLDAQGNLLVADTGNHRILRRTPAGAWSVFAGTGTSGARGDGGPAAQAEFFEPAALAIDAAGAVYVHDRGNGFLRRIQPNGVVERINSTGASTETLIQDLPLGGVADIATDRAGQIHLNLRDRIASVSAQGRVAYVAGNGQRVGISRDGDVATESPLGVINGLTVDGEGRLVWSESLRIRRLEPNGRLATIAGRGVEPPTNRPEDHPDPGQALSAYLRQPAELTLAPDGSLLIADGFGGWLRRLRDGKVSSITGVPWAETYADGIPAIFVRGKAPEKGLVALPDGRIFFIGDNGRRIRVIDAEGYVDEFAWLQGMTARALAPGPNGSLFVLGVRLGTDLNQNAYVLLMLSPTGQITRVSADRRSSGKPVIPGRPLAEFSASDAPLAYDPQRGFLYTADSIERRIVVIGEPSAVEIDTEPSGQQVIVDGSPVKTPQLFRWLPGEYHTVEALAESDGVSFSSWTHGSGRVVTWMPPGGPSRVVARFGSPTAGN